MFCFISLINFSSPTFWCRKYQFPDILLMLIRLCHQGFVGFWQMQLRRGKILEFSPPLFLLLSYREASAASTSEAAAAAGPKSHPSNQMRASWRCARSIISRCIFDWGPDHSTLNIHGLSRNHMHSFTSS